VKQSELTSLQDRLHSHTTAIVAYISSDSRGAIETLRAEVVRIAVLINAYIYQPRIMSADPASDKASNNNPDVDLSDEAAWQRLRADLLRSEVDSKVIREHDASIKASFLAKKHEAADEAGSPCLETSTSYFYRHTNQKHALRWINVCLQHMILVKSVADIGWEPLK